MTKVSAVREALAPKELVLPKGVKTPKEPPVDKAKQLPKPQGYRILCAIPSIEDTYEGGIIKADSTKKIEESSTVVLFVLALGDECYADKQRFPNGPWCKQGDFIITRAYAGTRINIHGQEFRIINDDSVEAVVEDPRGITRV